MPHIRLSRRHLLALAPLTALAVRALPASAAASPEAEFRDLLVEFRKCPGIEADFEEEKQIALLAAPLKQSGVIYFRAPSSLARIVTHPTRSHVVLKGSRIIAQDDGGRRTVDLSDKPALRALIGSLQHLLSGDEERLLSSYAVEMKGSATKDWTAVLRPRTSELRKMINAFTLSGRAVAIATLKVEENNGDVSSTRFTRVNTRRVFTPEEVLRTFEI
jgi:hypothetical protein